jgi:hypothetical protein
MSFVEWGAALPLCCICNLARIETFPNWLRIFWLVAGAVLLVGQITCLVIFIKTR